VTPVEKEEDFSQENRGRSRNQGSSRPRSGRPSRNGPPQNQNQNQNQQWQQGPPPQQQQRYGGPPQNQGYNQGHWGPPPPPNNYYGPPPPYQQPPQQGYYQGPTGGPDLRHVARQENYRRATQKELFAVCRGCDRYILRNEMEGINVRVYHQDAHDEKIRLRFCSDCHEEWVLDMRDNKWENNLVERDQIPPDAIIIGEGNEVYPFPDDD